MHTGRRRGAERLPILVLAFAASVVPAFSQTTAQGTETGVSKASSMDEVSLLKEQLASQQKQIEQLRGALENQKKMIERLTSDLDGAPARETQSQVSAPNLGEVASTSPVIPKLKGTSDGLSGALGHPAAGAPSAAPLTKPPQGRSEEVAPLQLRIGSASIIPVGFVDFTSVFRSHDGGSGIGTNFASIPY